MKQHIQPSKFIKKLKAYQSASQKCWRVKNCRNILKLDWNESLISPSPLVLKSIKEFLNNKPINWYPDIEAVELRKALSRYTKLPINYIQVFNGSDAALEYICRAFLSPGDEVIIRIPTYDNFRIYAESCGGKLRLAKSVSPFVANVDDILKLINNRTKLIYLVNPNNPTGFTWTENQIRQILIKAKHSLLILDEAYFEYYGKTMSQLVFKYHNIIITRSFSKAFGLAGLRCGYILTDPANIEIINKIRVGKSVNSLAQIAARAALGDLKYMRKQVEIVNSTKNWLIKSLSDMNIKAISTPCNFILLQVRNPKELISYLQKHNIFVRDISKMPQLKNYIRITIGPKKKMALLIKHLKGFYGK